MNSPPRQPGFDPLVTAEDLQAHTSRAPGRAPAGPSAIARFENRLKQRAQGWWNDPKKSRRNRLATYITLAALLAGGAAGYWTWGLVHQPDYEDDGLDLVLDYTLLTDEFNKLPIKERLALLQQLVDRMKSMDAGDSAMMAAFAAGIAGKAREQLMENASKLAIDMFDQYADKYDTVPPEDREKYIEDSMLDLVKTVESLGRGGVPRDVPDDERLADMKRDAQRDQKRMAEGDRQETGKFAGRVFEFMQSNVGTNASPEQRAKGTLLMRDMTRHLRGQDLNTGKPLPQKEQPTAPAKKPEEPPK